MMQPIHLNCWKLLFGKCLVLLVIFSVCSLAGSSSQQKIRLNKTGIHQLTRMMGALAQVSYKKVHASTKSSPLMTTLAPTISLTPSITNSKQQSKTHKKKTMAALATIKLPNDDHLEGVDLNDDGNGDSNNRNPHEKASINSSSNNNFTAIYTHEAALLRNLFEERDYSSKARPALYPHLPVNVSLELVLLKINELIEIDQEIVISGFLKVSWNDNRLIWTPQDFGGIEWIVSDIGYIWLPDLALINSDDVYAITRDNRFPIRIDSNGNVLFVPAGKISARCELDLRFFPFDEQLCKYRFESWVYTSDLVMINGVNFTIDQSHYVKNPQWAITMTIVKSQIVGYEAFKFSQTDFIILLKRKSLFFLTYTVFPSAVISSLQIISHLLPVTGSERINFGTTTLIAFSVFHISVVEQVPKSSEFIPLLAIYVDSLMCFIGLSLVECFFLMSWISRVGTSLPSPTAWYIMVEIFGPFLFLGQNGQYWRRNYLRVLQKLNARRDVVKKSRRTMIRQDDENSSSSAKERRRYNNFNNKKNLAMIGKLIDKWQENSTNNLLSTGIENCSSEKLNNKRRRINFRRRSSSAGATGFNNVNTAFTARFSDAIAETEHKNRYLTVAKSRRSSPLYTMQGGSNTLPKIMFTAPTAMSSVFRDLPHVPFVVKKASDDDKEKYENVGDNNLIYETLASYRRHSDYSQIMPNGNDNDTINSSNGDEQNNESKRKSRRNKAPATATISEDYRFEEFAQQMVVLEAISKDLEAISIGLAHHSLKRECLSVWTTFITAIDRIVSLGLLLLFIAMPVYLFYYYPSNAAVMAKLAQLADD